MSSLASAAAGAVVGTDAVAFAVAAEPAAGADRYGPNLFDSWQLQKLYLNSTIAAAASVGVTDNETAFGSALVFSATAWKFAHTHLLCMHMCTFWCIIDTKELHSKRQSDPINAAAVPAHEPCLSQIWARPG